MLIREWTLNKLEPVRNRTRVIIRDGLQLLPVKDSALDQFARENGFLVIGATTNLAFRDLYEKALQDTGVEKILLIDRAPKSRRQSRSPDRAPPPFYPDFLDGVTKNARIEIDLREFLRDQTGDLDWPEDANEPRYARLISRHLNGVLRAHENLRTTHESRFADRDFKTIVAFAALGIAESAFKMLDAEDYWKIGLLGHQALEELEDLAPEVTKPIREQLAKAPAPFSWFTDRDAETVIRAFYLSVILSQHLDQWHLLLANIDPSLANLKEIETSSIMDAAAKLVRLDPRQAERDLEVVEHDLDKDSLKLMLLDQMNISEPEGFAAAVEKENYSTLVRSLSLLMALENLLSSSPSLDACRRVSEALAAADEGAARFVDSRSSLTWSHLKQAFNLAWDIQAIREDLAKAVKTLKVMKPKNVTFNTFRKLWCDKGLSRLEYFVSSLERIVGTGDLLPAHEGRLPSVFGNAIERVRQSVSSLTREVQKGLEDFNRRFQELVAEQYPDWLAKDGEPILTSQFLRRCLKPNWDPQTEKAALLIFDGMRHDIWDVLLRPLLLDRMDLLHDLPGSSLLPSETHVTRKAICAGTCPDEFDTRQGEDKLLKVGLKRELGLDEEVEVVEPDGSGTAETVRYRAGNLDVYIFELCDRELHKIQVKTLNDGRQVPSRPLAFVYQQHIKNLIDTEVMAVMRGLEPGTKVFITADHGFGPVSQERLDFDHDDLNEPEDCMYLSSRLKVALKEVSRSKTGRNAIEFTPHQLRMPKEESRHDRNTGHTLHKTYQAIVFPKVGYAFRRPGQHFRPDAFTHGGISVQELMIPMVVLRVRPEDEGLLALDSIAGPESVMQGEEVEFRLPLCLNRRGETDLRVDIEAMYGRGDQFLSLPQHVLYVSAEGRQALVRFKVEPQGVQVKHQQEGQVEQVLTITARYQDHQKSATSRFTVRLDAKGAVQRIPNPQLGNIMGLTPKSMR